MTDDEARIRALRAENDKLKAENAELLKVVDSYNHKIDALGEQINALFSRCCMR